VSSDAPAEVYRVGLRAVPFLLSVADLLIGWLLLWHAEVALDAIDVATTQRDSAFYRGKVAAAVFFADTMLSRLAADRVVIESQGLAPMELDEEAFYGPSHSSARRLALHVGITPLARNRYCTRASVVQPNASPSPFSMVRR
jgi:hypothetical protein